MKRGCAARKPGVANREVPVRHGADFRKPSEALSRIYPTPGRDKENAGETSQRPSGDQWHHPLRTQVCMRFPASVVSLRREVLRRAPDAGVFSAASEFTVF